MCVSEKLIIHFDVILLVLEFLSLNFISLPPLNIINNILGIIFIVLICHLLLPISYKDLDVHIVFISYSKQVIITEFYYPPNIIL